MSVRQLHRHDLDDLAAALELIRQEFEYMDGLVDPPSSVHRLTLETLASGPGIVWVVGEPVTACIVMTPQPDVLYLGKLAVAADHRGRGLAKALIEEADRIALARGLLWLELETRIELSANQKTFTAMGFVEWGRSAHAGYDRPTSITYRRPVDRKM